MYVAGYRKRHWKHHGLLQAGNIDLTKRPMVRNKDGSVSTVRSITVKVDGHRALVLPTVIGNKVVSNKRAIKHWQKTGKHLGLFKNERAANHYAQALHRVQAHMYPNG